MVGPACSAEPPHRLNGGAGGGSEKRARLIGLSQYNRLPQHIHMGRFMKKTEERDAASDCRLRRA